MKIEDVEFELVNIISLEFVESAFCSTRNATFTAKPKSRNGSVVVCSEDYAVRETIKELAPKLNSNTQVVTDLGIGGKLLKIVPKGKVVEIDTEYHEATETIPLDVKAAELAEGYREGKMTAAQVVEAMKAFWG